MRLLPPAPSRGGASLALISFDCFSSCFDLFSSRFDLFSSCFDLFSSSSPPGAAASFTAVISADNFSSCHHAVFIHPSVFSLGCLLSPWKQAAILDNHMMPKLKETHIHTHTHVYQLHRFNRLLTSHRTFLLRSSLLAMSPSTKIT